MGEVKKQKGITLDQRVVGKYRLDRKLKWLAL